MLDENTPTWLVLLISIGVGAFCGFLGMIGMAFQTWANNKRK